MAEWFTYFSHYFHYHTSYDTFLLRLNVLKRDDLYSLYGSPYKENKLIFRYVYNNGNYYKIKIKDPET